MYFPIALQLDSQCPFFSFAFANSAGKSDTRMSDSEQWSRQGLGHFRYLICPYRHDEKGQRKTTLSLPTHVPSIMLDKQLCLFSAGQTGPPWVMPLTQNTPKA